MSSFTNGYAIYGDHGDTNERLWFRSHVPDEAIEWAEEYISRNDGTGEHSIMQVMQVIDEQIVGAVWTFEDEFNLNDDL